VIVHLLDIEWLLSTLFDASLLTFEPPATAAPFFVASARAGSCGTREPWQSGNYVGIFVQRPLDITPQAAQCGAWLAGYLTVKQETVVA
jgi:hypothetical protein